jgi:hypothetical protein
MEWLQLLMSCIWRWPRYGVGWFDWHHWRWYFKVIARIFIHGRGIVLAPTTAVPSHISPLTAAILSLMRLMRVCVHAVLYVDWTNAEPDLSTTVLAN